MSSQLWKKGAHVALLTAQETRFYSWLEVSAMPPFCRLLQVQLEAKGKEQDLEKLRGDAHLLQV